jgi:predicted lipid-binding transport protein (Tim44 family)
MMGEGSGFLEIILLAMVAAFIFLRLRNVLGRRTGHEQSNPRTRLGQNKDADDSKTAHDDDNVIALPERDSPSVAPDGVAEESPLAATLTQISLADRNFDGNSFLEGAGGAYEMIVSAFAKGDMSEVQPFLGDRVLQNFSDAIESREQDGQVQETTIVGVKSTDLIDADFDGKTAELTVKFVTEMINVTRDAEERIVAGDPSATQKVTDIWTFARKVRSRDPNWMLTATRSSN